MTQRKRSRSKTLEDFVLKSPEVSHQPSHKTRHLHNLHFCLIHVSSLHLSTTGETGLLVAKIGAKTPFNGYANKQQTEKKKLRDVFVKGDLYFNSGDLLRIDNEGFVFFQDRIGDTFRFEMGSLRCK